MRISDWSSDVCSSDLSYGRPAIFPQWLYRPGPHRLCLANLLACRAPENHHGSPLAWLENRYGRRSPVLNRHYGEHRSEEHTSELQSLMRISYAVYGLKNKIAITEGTGEEIRRAQV